MWSWGARVLHFCHHSPLKLLCVSRGGGGGLHCYHHFPELKFLCVCGGGVHFYQTFTWMCSNVGLRHNMLNQTSDFRLYTHS